MNDTCKLRSCNSMFFAVVAIWLACTSNVFAQRLFSKLPADGTWAKYEMSGKTTMSNGDVNEHERTLLIRVVGTEHTNMDEYRWIEIEQRQKNVKDSMPSIYRFKVKESDIGSGGDPLASLEKCWIISQAPNLDIVKEYNTETDSIQFLEWFLPPHLTDKKTLEAKTIESSIGKLECEGSSGVFNQSRAPNYVQRHTFTAYVHNKSPFGTVSFHRVTEAIVNDELNHKLEYSMVLTETGTGAKSAAPDLK